MMLWLVLVLVLVGVAWGDFNFLTYTVSVGENVEVFSASPSRSLFFFDTATFFVEFPPDFQENQFSVRVDEAPRLLTLSLPEVIPHPPVSLSPNLPPTVNFTVPGSWSGKLVFVYSNDEFMWMLSVRPVNPPAVFDAVVVFPAQTWQAYNGWGGRSIYTFWSRDEPEDTSIVHLYRPISFSEQKIADFVAHGWFANRGIKVRHVIDHELETFCPKTRSVVFHGHPEYFSEAQYRCVGRMAQDGNGVGKGRVINFAGNSLYLKIVFQNSWMEVCNRWQKDPSSVAKRQHTFVNESGGLWTEMWKVTPGTHTPERYVGVHFRIEVFCKVATPASVPFYMTCPNHWVFDTTPKSLGLFGRSFGRDVVPVNWLCGGDAAGWEVDHLTDASPQERAVIATADYYGSSTVPMVIFRENKTIGFAAGSINYAFGLIHDEVIYDTTLNVLTNFLGDEDPKIVDSCTDDRKAMEWAILAFQIVIFIILIGLFIVWYQHRRGAGTLTRRLRRDRDRALGEIGGRDRDEERTGLFGARR